MLLGLLTIDGVGVDVNEPDVLSEDKIKSNERLDCVNASQPPEGTPVATSPVSRIFRTGAADIADVEHM
jgi:hypothetical protein